jgi:Kef-type K+ transport system membrane component KefB
MKKSALYVIVTAVSLCLWVLAWMAFYDGEFLKSGFFGFLTAFSAVTVYRTLNRQSLVEKRKND